MRDQTPPAPWRFTGFQIEAADRRAVARVARGQLRCLLEGFDGLFSLTGGGQRNPKPVLGEPVVRIELDRSAIHTDRIRSLAGRADVEVAELEQRRNCLGGELARLLERLLCLGELVLREVIATPCQWDVRRPGIGAFGSLQVLLDLRVVAP
jgi:hypothetical protein